MNAKEFLERHSLIIGVALMFLCTWTIDLSHSGVLPFQFPFVVTIFLGWGFVFAALLMTGLTRRREGMISLLKRYLIWRVNWKWYLAALLLLPGLQFTSVLLTALWTGVRADFSQLMVYKIIPLTAPVPALIVPWFVFEMLTNGEEMGWRGYILPRLQARYNAVVSSLVVGVIWGFWHLPKFFGTGASGERSLLWFTIFSIALSILFTWLYNQTRGSLLLVTLFHASSNTAGMFLPVSFAAAGGVASNLLILIYILAAMVVTFVAGPARLSRTEEKQALE